MGQLVLGLSAKQLLTTRWSQEITSREKQKKIVFLQGFLMVIIGQRKGKCIHFLEENSLCGKSLCDVIMLYSIWLFSLRVNNPGVLEVHIKYSVCSCGKLFQPNWALNLGHVTAMGPLLLAHVKGSETKYTIPCSASG